VKRKVVVVTGANRGIGHHLARSLVDAGRYAVAGLDQFDENLTAREVHSDALSFYQCDVTDRAAVEATVQSIVETWGRLDILVNNACLAIFGRFEEKDVEETRREFEVNYFGYVHMIRSVLPYMKAQGDGIIHNVCSGVGLTGFPGLHGYASTKGAIEALTRTLAMELKVYGIHVSIVHPPLTATRSAAPLGVPEEMMHDPSEVGRQLAARVESRRAVITPGFQTAAGLGLQRHFPGLMGRLLGKMTERARGSG